MKSINLLFFGTFLIFSLNNCSKNSGIDPTPTPTPTPAVTSVSTTSVSVTGINSVTVTGTLAASSTVTIAYMGVVYSLNTNPAVNTSGSTEIQLQVPVTGNYSLNFAVPQPLTTYHVRAYAAVNGAIYYGSDLTVTTENPYSGVNATDIQPKTATLIGTTINSTTFSNQGRGFVYGTFPNPTTSNTNLFFGPGAGTFTVSMVNLTANTTYYVRPYVITSTGYVYGAEFTVLTTGYFGPAGGYVIYDKGVFSNGWRYLEADQNTLIYNSSPLMTWGCLGTSISFTTTSIGDGLNNTNLIVAGCSTAGIAARVADNYIKNGYSDWFLPSRDEGLVVANGLKSIGFTLNDFWVSNEATSTTAMYIHYNVSTAVYSAGTAAKNNNESAYAVRRY